MSISFATMIADDLLVGACSFYLIELRGIFDSAYGNFLRPIDQ